MPDDVLQTLARYAPTETTLATEWDAARAREVLAGVLGDTGAARPPRGPVHDIPLRFLPAGARRHRRSAALTAVAAVAVLAAAGGILVAVARSGGDGTSPSAGAPFDPPAGLSNTSIGAGQYSYRVVQQIGLAADGKPRANDPAAMIDRSWVSTNGDIVSIRTGSQNACLVLPRQGGPDFIDPSRSFFASLPTDVAKLNRYLRDHVTGSSARDLAVFVAVGDMLRTADGLASPRLRAALLGVLSRTPGVTVHQSERDYLGRPAIRADFVYQSIQPGVLEALYFDPSNFQLLEQRDGNSGRPTTTYAGPSPAYDAAPTEPGTSAGPLTGAAGLQLMTTEKVVDTLPTLPAGCQRG